MLLLVQVLHVIISIFLIVAVLLQSGKGGGLSDAFGGGGVSSAFSGTSIIEKNLYRITIALAVLFGVTSLTLYYFTLIGALG